MVDVGVYNINKDPCTIVTGDKIFFTAPKPTIIQPSEIIKVRTSTAVRVPSGYIITVVSAPELLEKACELFPSVRIIGDQDWTKEIELAIRNGGRGQINLMAGDVMAIGYLSKIAKISEVTFDPNVTVKPELPNTQPQKKNAFNFEVK